LLVLTKNNQGPGKLRASVHIGKRPHWPFLFKPVALWLHAQTAKTKPPQAAYHPGGGGSLGARVFLPIYPNVARVLIAIIALTCLHEIPCGFQHCTKKSLGSGL